MIHEAGAMGLYFAVRLQQAGHRVRLVARTGWADAPRVRIATEDAEETVELVPVADVQRALWKKLALIASYGGVGAVTGLTVGQTRADEGTRSLVWEAIEEVRTVARAHGVEFTEEDAAEVFAVYADGFAAGTTSSMQRDLAAGRPSELEDQTGTVVARAGPGRWVWLSRCAGSSIGRSRPVRRSLGPRHEPAGDREEMGRDESGVNPGRGLLPEAVDADP
ncbi:ketopantoate reductase C-terminal domain-containing protein [Rothia kristinae]|uniref:ketopantoate reductase family protein n=1 Tax=Rothia kristinae TaxID=37923 RepID=UPI00344496BB